MRNAIVLATCMILMVTAQTLWKIGLSRLGGVEIGSSGIWSQLLKAVQSWRILSGMAIFGVTTVLWFDLLSRMQLSRLYPMMSFTYVIAFFTGWWFLGESPSWQRFAGILVICFGIFLVSRTGH